MLRFLIKQEIEAAGIDGMEHGAWGWAEKQLDENWKKFQQSFTDPNQYEYESFDSIEELFEDLHADEITPEENERRFQYCLEQIRKFTREDLVKLMGKEWVEDYRRRFQ